jgi:hypothetical protein
MDAQLLVAPVLAVSAAIGMRRARQRRDRVGGPDIDGLLRTPSIWQSLAACVASALVAIVGFALGWIVLGVLGIIGALFFQCLALVLAVRSRRNAPSYPPK